MTDTRNTRADVVQAAGRLFAEKGYHGTSMRDLGRELGLQGSSLYSHIRSKEDLLVDVVQRAADLFQASAARAMALEGDDRSRLRALIAGHVDVLLDHVDEARTFLNEARALDEPDRARVLGARDGYEQTFRDVLARGSANGTFRADLDPVVTGILLLSILNSVDRWYRADGRLDRRSLVDSILGFALDGIGAPSTD
ncbi:MAG TPA: TetR/AcrR family transcriptional regulator [Acidimicrobiia bacterium]|nr:TetR/AcrR family transcriptional regulator [Acidimicrobiia bacterium]